MKILTTVLFLTLISNLLFANNQAEAFKTATCVIKKIETSTFTRYSRSTATVEYLTEKGDTIQGLAELFSLATSLGFTKEGDKIKVKYRASNPGLVYTIPRWFLMFVLEEHFFMFIIPIIILMNYRRLKKIYKNQTSR